MKIIQRIGLAVAGLMATVTMQAQVSRVGTTDSQ